MQTSFAAADATSWTADVTIHRDLLGLFDGLDLSTVTSDAVAWGLLSNLFDHATVEVVLSET